MNGKLLKICAGTLGAAMFATAAFADATIGSGYNGVKSSVKKTAEFITSEAESFTMKGYVSVAVDGTELYKSDSTFKVNLSDNSIERTGNYYQKNGEIGSTYSYDNGVKRVHSNSQDVTYYVTNYDTKRDLKDMYLDNPFEEEMAQDFEKIVDTVARPYEFFIQTVEADGIIRFTANAQSDQIPSFVNAVSSFILKYNGLNGIKASYGIDMTNDLYVKSMKALYEADDTGIFNKSENSIEFQGKDTDGTVHSLTLSFGAILSDVNNTKIAQPDLEGKEVKVYEERYSSNRKFDSSYQGLYKTNIVGKNESGFYKSGEIILNIDSVKEDGNIEGSISAPFISGGTANFISTYVQERSSGDVQFTYLNESGEERVSIVRVPYDRMDLGSVSMEFNLIVGDEGLIYPDTDEVSCYDLDRSF